MIAHKWSLRIAPEQKKSPYDSKPRKQTKRYVQGFSAFDTTETAADSKHGVDGFAVLQ
jgi:hypothetical protein